MKQLAPIFITYFLEAYKLKAIYLFEKRDENTIIELYKGMPSVTGHARYDGQKHPLSHGLLRFDLYSKYARKERARGAVPRCPYGGQLKAVG